MDEVLGGATDAVTGRRVFGEPYEKDGVTVIPAAAVSGGGGGGEDGGGEGSGRGGGFGMSARPVGAFVIKGDEVTWVPAADTTKVLVVALIVVFLVLRRLLKRR
jgi:uncharacterized spore protein YtfJ